MNPELLKALLKLLAFNEARIEATVNGDSDAVSITEAQNAFAPFSTAANERETVMVAANGYFDMTEALMKLLGYSDEEIDSFREDKTGAPETSDLLARLQAKFGEAATASNENTELRQLVAANEVEAAISSGKIKPAEKDTRIKALVEAEDFTLACNELSELEDGKAVKTKAVTDGLATQQSKGLMAANEASEQFQSLVAANEKSGMKYDDAWAAAERSTEGKKLLDVIHKDRTAE